MDHKRTGFPAGQWGSMSRKDQDDTQSTNPKDDQEKARQTLLVEEKKQTAREVNLI